MPGCVLRAAGRDLDVAAFLSSTTLDPCAVYYRGQKRYEPEPPPKESGINIKVSTGTNLAAQIADSIAFLTKHRSEMERLLSTPGFESAVLDFGVAQTGAYVDYHDFPADLVKLAAQFGLSLKLSEYPFAKSGTPAG
jgi:hypothetical protein